MAVAFQGPCLVHRAELLQIGGAWPEALEEARHACSRVRPNDRTALSEAHYQDGEIHRLRGAYEEAERCFKEASVHGHEPQPGLALLLLSAAVAARAVPVRPGHTGTPAMEAA
jgi:hypothetical protein